jgi:putative flippase GtrA
VRALPPLVRYLVIGGLAVGLNLVLFWLLVGLFGWPYLNATVVVFIAGNLFGYAANRRFTFESLASRGPELARWYLVMGISLAANLAAMAALVDGLGLHYLVASVVLSIAFALVNFAAHDQFTFRGRAAAQWRPPPASSR